jgi:hypothetical protein
MKRRNRLGFSLLEAMIAASILVLTLVIIGRIQAAAVDGALRAERLAVATELAQEKMAEVTFVVEHEGVGSEDVYERGNFKDFGNEARLDFDDSLEEYRWEYWIEEIEFEVSGDLFSMLGGGDEGGGVGGGLAESGMGQQAMGMMGMGPDQINEQLQRFIRRTRVRVYWGDSKEASERGREVVLTNHLVKPMGFPVPPPPAQGN